MKTKTLFASALAVLGLTACEKGLGNDIGDVGNEQVKNSVLQVRTRGASGDEATVAYPVAVYVFVGDECKASQTICDEGQTLNIALTEGTYSVYGCGRCVGIGLCSAYGVECFDDIGDYTTRGKETDRFDGGFGYGDAGGRRDEHRHAWHGEEDDADSGCDHQEGALGGYGCHGDDCPAMAEPDHRRDVQHDERQQHHCADSPRGREDVEEHRQCLSAATKQSARQRECEHHYGRHNEDLYLQYQRRTGGGI